MVPVGNSKFDFVGYLKCLKGSILGVVVKNIAWYFPFYFKVNLAMLLYS